MAIFKQVLQEVDGTVIHPPMWAVPDLDIHVAFQVSGEVEGSRLARDGRRGEDDAPNRLRGEGCKGQSVLFHFKGQICSGIDPLFPLLDFLSVFR